MTLVIPEHFAAVVHQFALTGDAEVMAVSYGIGVDITSVRTANDFAADLQTQFEANLLSQFSNQYHTIGCEVRYQDSALPAPPTIGFAAGSGVGARSSDVAPQNTAILVHKRTATGGRGGRGRMYFPGVIESTVDAKGTLTSGEVSGWNTALAAWLADILTIVDVIAPVLLHDANGAFAAAAPHDITSMTCDPTIATQRRRLRP